jgi:hypothetical protein
MDFKTFFDQAPAINPNRSQVKGADCGIGPEDIQDPITPKIRYLDKLIDERAKGQPVDKGLRRQS